MDSYTLSRNFFNWSFENPEKIKPSHIALYFFCIEHCNRLGWKEKFGLPTTMAKEAIGIRSYNTYIETLNDLVEFGFIQLIEKSKNQHSSNIVALSNFDRAHNKALDKALIKHTTKQRESTQQSIDSIDKQETINKEEINKPIIYSDEFNAYLTFAKSTTPKLLKMKSPLQQKEFEKLKLEFGKEAMRLIFLSMENKKDLLKKYDSVYLTALSWLKNNNTESKPKKETTPISFGPKKQINGQS